MGASGISIIDKKEITVDKNNSTLAITYYKESNVVELSVQNGSDSISNIDLDFNAVTELGKWFSKIAEEIKNLPT